MFNLCYCVLMIQSCIECVKSFQKCSCVALTGSRLCGMCMFVCLWDACACRVWSLCVAGAVVAVPEPGGAVKERGNELCFISFFLWSERAKKDSSSGSEIGGGGCMCVRGESTTFSSLFDCFLVRFFGPIHVIWMIYFLCMFWKINKKIYNGLCCALETEFTKSWPNIWNIISIRYSEGDECFICIQFI